MPRVITIEKTVFKFDELESSAKETALDYFRCSIETYDYSESVLDDAETIAALIGIDFDTVQVPLMNGSFRTKPKIYWSGFSSQGDGASFLGCYEYKKGAAKAVKAHAPSDKKLHAIVDDLQAAQKKHFYSLYARIASGRLANHYCHENTVSIEVTDSRDEYRDIGDSEEKIAECMRDFMRWIYRQLEAEYEYQTSEEAIKETIASNEYEFTESGNLA